MPIQTTSDAGFETVKKLRKIINKTDWKQRELATRIGTNQGTISKWLTGMWFPSREYSAQIDLIYDRLFPDESMAQISEITEETPMIENVDTGAEKPFTISPSGVSVRDTAKDGVWLLPRALGKRFPNPADVKVITMVGDSMLPTIPPGSHVFIDTTQRSLASQDVYAIMIDDTVTVRRIRTTPRSEEILMIYDNKAAFGEPDKVMKEDITVIGRVIGVLSWRD